MSAALGLLRVVPIWAWALAAILAWGGWQKHRAERSTKAAAVAEQRAAVEAATAEAERQARAQEQEFADRARSAADAYSKQVAEVRASAGRARVGLDSLRDAISAAPACPASPAAAAASGVDATAGLRIVVRECAAALSQVAEAADASDARLTALQQYIKAIQPDAAPKATP